MNKAGGSFVYFAYGSNLLTERIHYQNPSAKSIGIACLQDYKLDFRLPSKRWGGKAATIIQSQGDHVCGVLWELDMEHLATLDDQEGVPKGLYRRFTVNVEAIDRETGVAKSENRREAISYQVRDEHMSPEDGDNRPSAVYKKVFMRGAREHRLPDYYVKKLESIEDNGSNGDANLGLPLDLKDEIPTEKDKNT